MRILVVEDEILTAKILKRGLESQSYAVDVEANGEKGFYRARTNDYDLIILDNGLPGKEGPAFCKEIRERDIATPILMLSAWAEAAHKAALLEYGADDYMTKPYSFIELSARVRALLRRPPLAASAAQSVDGLALDHRTYTAACDGRAVYLTPKEFAFLEYLIRNRGRVLSRAMILEHVWDGRVDLFTNAIETHVANVRKKLGRVSPRKFIRTVPGRGYMFDAES